jgi:hypothetical protein
MAQKVNINGKLVRRPGVYALVKSGIQNNPARLDYGVVCIIDDGIGAAYGGGKGGEKYEFNRIQDFRDFVKGGPLWDLAAPLWKPVPNKNIQGISQLVLIQARETTQASITYTLTNGSFTINTKDEGLNANGALNTNSELKKGYATKLVETFAPTLDATFVTTVDTPAGVGVAQVNEVTATNVHEGDKFSITLAAETVTYIAEEGDTVATVHTAVATLINANTTMAAIVTASTGGGNLIITADVTNTAFTQTSVAVTYKEYVLKFYHGAYRGLDALNNTPYDGIGENDSRIKGQLLFQSVACATVQELIDWMQDSSDFASGFELATGYAATGSLVTADEDSAYVLASGGTESYSTDAWDDAKDTAKAVGNNFFLSMKYDDDVLDAHNTEILSDVINEGKYDRFLIVAGGATVAELDSVSIPAAQEYDNDKVIVVHGDGLTTIQGGFKKRSQLWKAANVLGRLCGLEPQTPVTFKSTGLDAEANPLSEQDLEDALDAGVLTTYTDEELGYNVVLQGINTLQANDNLVNEDGTSYSIQVKRITAQLNKEVALFLKRKFFGKDTVGPNRNTVTEADLVAAVEGYLQKRTASTLQDDLIIRFQNITATTDGAVMRDNYEFVPNFEVDIIIVTGIILEK